MNLKVARQALPAVLGAVLITSSPLLAASGGFWLLAMIMGGLEEDWLNNLAAGVTVFLVAGVAGSYLVHEMGHVVAMVFVPGIERIVVHAGFMRISLSPGALPPRAALTGAVAGPGSCVVVGLLLLVSGAMPWAAWCYLAHAVFLLPIFGDGQTAVAAIRMLRGCSPRLATARGRRR